MLAQLSVALKGVRHKVSSAFITLCCIPLRALYWFYGVIGEKYTFLRWVVLALGFFGYLVQISAPQVVPMPLCNKLCAILARVRRRAIQRWQALFPQLQDVDEATKLKAVNAFFNAEIRFVGDLKHWKKDDYWATPEAASTHGGDCEDFVIAKYRLAPFRVDGDKLRITCCKTIRLNEAHMVLTYFPTKDAVPLVLDNP